jgi:NADH-quinone oxidoreductase subunit D
VSETVTLTIDGQSVTVPKGTNVLEAARTLGLDISAFCYHPGLPIVAQCRQCLVQIPDGPTMVDDPRVSLPPKAATYNTIESMIRHFKHIMDGIRVPPGEAYTFVEGGNGELGFFIVADGTGRPYKAYCRSPSFVHLSTAEMLFKNHFIADVVPIFGMINMIGGECDK